MRKLKVRCRNCGTLIEEGLYCSEACAREAETCPICGLPVVSSNPAGACQCQPEDFEFFTKKED